MYFRKISAISNQKMPGPFQKTGHLSLIPQEEVYHISPAKQSVYDCPSDRMPVDVAYHHCQSTSKRYAGFRGFAYLMLFVLFFHFKILHRSLIYSVTISSSSFFILLTAAITIVITIIVSIVTLLFVAVVYLMVLIYAIPLSCYRIESAGYVLLFCQNSKYLQKISDLQKVHYGQIKNRSPGYLNSPVTANLLTRSTNCSTLSISGLSGSVVFPEASSSFLS